MCAVSQTCGGSRLLQVICTVSAVVAYYYTTAFIFPVLIAAGGLATILLKRKDVIKVRARTDVALGLWIGPSCMLSRACNVLPFWYEEQC